MRPADWARGAATFTLLTLCAHAATAQQDGLRFNPNDYSVVHVSLDGAPLEVRRYHVVYVAKPTVVDITKPPVMAGPGGPGAPGGPQAARSGLPGAAPGRAAPPGFGAPNTDPL